MLDFINQVVLVTGSSRGIGRAIAHLFAEQGARVAVHYHRDQAAAEATLAELPGGPHYLVAGDLADATAVAAFVDAVVAQAGRLDVLVNNAAIYEDHPLADVDYETWQASWRRVIDTNVLGAANASYCAARHMIAQGGGRIVNVSSRGAFRGEPSGPAYGASKAALNAMSQSLAKYLAPYGISVSVVAPGFVQTDMAREALSGQSGVEIRAQSPFNRVARPEEVAYAVLFLASEGAEFMTGAIIDVNGASYLRT
jgi:NAD(P)-dependent dehydrogenase (short-subunit alcohol dehydrogenase family)